MADSRTATSTGRWRTVLDVAVQIAFIAAAGTLIYASIFRPAPSQFQSETPAARRSGSPIPSEPVSLEGATLHGATGATVALIVFSDFECPYCARFARETLPTLYEKYVRPGKVRIAFRHYPLTIHPHAQKAAEAAECAGAQGKFWEMHDRLFENPKQLGTENLGQSARSLGLEPTRFERCLAGEMTAKIHEDANQARALGVSGTPAFLIGAVQSDGRVKVAQRLSGAQPSAVFESALDRLVAGPSARR